MKGKDATVIKPKCNFCGQEIKSWQWTAYIHNGVRVCICKNCAESCMKNLCGKVKTIK